MTRLQVSTYTRYVPEEYVLQPTPQPPVEEHQKPFPKVYVALGLIVFSLLFMGVGLVIGMNLTKPSSQAVTPPTPTPTPIAKDTVLPTPTPVSEIPQVQFLPGKQYLDDTYVVMQKTAPYQTIILSVSRIEQTKNFIEYTKVNYFNGQTWDRKTVTTTLQSSTVATNPLLRDWNETTSTSSNNPKPLATIQMPSGVLSFTSTDLGNEVSIQSLPGSTKFIYQGSGTLTVGTDTTPAYIFRSRTYSFNASDLSFLTQPQTTTSEWVVFWDQEGTFSYIDSHRPQNPTTPAQSLKIGVQEDASRKVLRTTQFSTRQVKNDEANLYQVTFNQPINSIIKLPTTNVVQKADNKTFTWNLGIGEGEIVTREGRSVTGIGIFEYILPL